MFKYHLILLFLFIHLYSVEAQTNLDEYAWVDSVFNTLTTDQKIGQLFMVRSSSKHDLQEIKKISSYIEQNHIGGICFFQGSVIKLAELRNMYQSRSRVPLLIGIDGENGLAMRIPDGTIKFPKQLTLGAIAEDNLIYEMGKEIANECKRIGVHMNFAPVVDINNNPDNPAINERSFGEDKFIVTTKAMAYMNGLQDNGLIATAKHFPGHGDTNVDSHDNLPILNHSIDRIYDVELFPFKALINQNINSIMIGHLQLPALENAGHRPASLSQRIITDLLRSELGYNGLIMTDAMEMKGVSKNYQKGIADAEAFLAGNDLIVLPEDLLSGIAAIKSYILEGKIFPSQLDASVRRILSIKYKAAAYHKAAVPTHDINDYLNRNEAIALKEKLIENALTLVADQENTLPFQNTADKKFMSVAFGSPEINAFQKRLSTYAEFTHFAVKKDLFIEEKNQILDAASKHDYVVLSTHDMSRQQAKNYGLTSQEIAFIRELSDRFNVVLCLFGNPYMLKNFENIDNIVMAYEEDDMFLDITAQALFGAVSFNGVLPISASPKFYSGFGISKKSLKTLGFASPERVGISTEKLNEIDRLAKEIIAKKAAPGCSIFVAKDNKVIYQKAFGNQSYANSKKIEKDDIYDLASLTKVLASTLSAMKLYDNGKLDLYEPISIYLPETMGTNKENLILADVMAHHAGLLPFIPFYETTMIKSKGKATLSPNIYCPFSKPGYTCAVTPRIYIKDSYADTIWNKILFSELRPSTDYKYSDLGFYFVKRITENVCQQKFDEYLNDEFYKPLGLKKTMFNPLRKININQIVPSENDTYWRNQVIHGTVHDMGAAMLGGVGGHAGLFSNTFEIGVIMQMLLNGGSYGGRNFINEATVQLFTARHHKSSRRGLGFDLKDLNKSGTELNVSEFCSDATFGHTGFTGTCAYADPINNIVFVFLSNRTYPQMNNNLLNKKDYRIKIQSAIYKAIIK